MCGAPFHLCAAFGASLGEGRSAGLKCKIFVHKHRTGRALFPPMAVVAAPVFVQHLTNLHAPCQGA